MRVVEVAVEAPMEIVVDLVVEWRGVAAEAVVVVNGVEDCGGGGVGSANGGGNGSCRSRCGCGGGGEVVVTVLMESSVP